jgi:hypothetical protein
MLPDMRSTVRIDDDLTSALKAEAARRNISFTRALNRALRAGLLALQRAGDEPRPAFRQRTARMGKPAVDLTRALKLSIALEDEEILDELNRRK